MESLDDDIGVVFEIDKKVLVLLDSFELPVRAGENKVEVEFGVGSKLNFDVFADAMEIHNYDLDSYFFHVFEGLDLVGFLLHADHKIMFLVVDNGAAVSNERIF